jgi:hypothetical protein
MVLRSRLRPSHALPNGLPVIHRDMFFPLPPTHVLA